MLSANSDPDANDLKVVKICLCRASTEQHPVSNAIGEFFAHVDAVTCAHIGRRSNRCLATGSADRLVNIWRIGDPHAQLTLSGHSDTVGCLKFTGDEEVLLSGCRDGSIRVWDLNHNGALRRRINGQNREITAIDPHHPYGEYFATGTVDGKMEIWSSKQRQRIASYPGHGSAVSVLKHSPDGHYIFVGHSSGAVKMWNLRAGKLFAELPFRNRGRVNTVAFNAQEMAFSSGSESGMIEVFEVWEQQINTFSTTEIDAPVRQMVFSGSGDMLFYASDSNMGVISVDQPQVAHLAYVDNISLANLVDLSYDATDSFIIAASIDNTAVSINSIAASERLHFSTKIYHPAIHQPFMASNGRESKRSAEQSSSFAPDTHPSDFREGLLPSTTATLDSDALTEHAIDDYVAVETIIPPLISDHENIMLTFDDRLTKIKQLCSLWLHGQVSESLVELLKMKDYVVTADFLAATQRRFNGGVLTLQLCPVLLAVVEMLFQSPHEYHAKSALKCLEMVLLCYSEVIRSTRKGPLLTTCDIARDERLAKCNECYEILQGSICDKLHTTAEGSDEFSAMSLNLINQIQSLS